MHTLQCYWGVDPVPLPLHGDQFTTLTHAEDVASMLAAVIDNPAAVGQVSKRAVTSRAYTSASSSGKKYRLIAVMYPKRCHAACL
jgi:nucleoside-diphosphate-sugar epimerase